MTFGDKIRKLRIEKKMTQQKLGAMVGVSYRTIRAWEVDGRYPRQSIWENTLYALFLPVFGEK